MTPQLIKLLFGGKDRVNAVGEMMRAVARTRTFPEGGKIAQQIFRWKGSGSRNKLENCRTITMANVLLKLAESCIKTSSKSLWESAGFPRPFWGHFSGAPESIYIWLSTVEQYYRLKLRPITALTDVSRAFDRLHHGLFKRKLYDFGLPRQLVELILEFISGIQVSLTCGNVKTDFVERGSTGVPQGSLEGMWNFGVYSDNIQNAIIRAGRGIVVGNENVRAVTYADDISPVNDSVASTNLALKAISDAGTFNSYRFKPSKCRIVGADLDGETVFTLGSRSIETKNSGLLLGAVINGTGIFAMEHIRRRAGMVDTHIKLIKSWRTRGLPFRIAYKNLFAAKVVPRFTYAFALLHLKEWGEAHELIQRTLERALCCTFGWTVPKKFKILPGVWSLVCGYPTVSALLRKLKLDMAARLKLGDHKAGRIFRNLYISDRGSFEEDVNIALDEWLLNGSWESLCLKTLTAFKRKVLRLSKKCWHRNLRTDGNLSWLYHNHRVFSGNMPTWAEWVWPKGKGMENFQTHFYCLLIGQHPAAGEEACCSHVLCRGKGRGPVYLHHYFHCVNFRLNCSFFRDGVNRKYKEYVNDGHSDIPLNVIEEILERPSGMWFGLFDPSLFDLGLKLRSLHELHRIVTMASVLSWGRYYPLP